MPKVAFNFRYAALALFAIAAITFLFLEFLPTSALTLTLIYLLVVLAIAARGERWPAILTAALAAGCLDYFFIPPLYRFDVSDVQGWLALATFFIVAVIASHLSIGLREERDRFAASQHDAERLYALSRSLLVTAESDDNLRFIVNKLIELYGFSEVAIYSMRSAQILNSSKDKWIDVERLEQSARQDMAWREESGRVTVMPITLGGSPLGSMAYSGALLSEAAQQNLSNTLAMGMAQAQALDAASRAEAVRRSEELKSIMIDALAHDLKTPLTSIEAAIEMLCHSTGMEETGRNDLLSLIEQESKRLKRLLGEAIHLSRVEAKRMKLDREAIDVRKLIDEAIALVGDHAGSHHFDVETPAGLPPICADRELIMQALKQLIDNAVKYSVKRPNISISSWAADGHVNIAVQDQGNGLTELEQSRIFEKFYRGGEGRLSIQGTGMGLAICKEIIEAHGGSILVESQVGHGSRFTMTLRAADETAPVGTNRA